jgi:hypothetical protein
MCAIKFGTDAGQDLGIYTHPFNGQTSLSTETIDVKNISNEYKKEFQQFKGSSNE